MNPKLPYILGLALQKELKTPIAVCKGDGFLHFLYDDVRVSMMQDTSFGDKPKEMLATILAGLKELFKQYHPPEKKHARR